MQSESPILAAWNHHQWQLSYGCLFIWNCRNLGIWNQAAPDWLCSISLELPYETGESKHREKYKWKNNKADKQNLTFTFHLKMELQNTISKHTKNSNAYKKDQQQINNWTWTHLGEN